MRHEAKNYRPRSNRILASISGAAILIALLLAGSLPAEKPPEPGEGQRACRSDVMTHCSTYIFGQRDRIQACLKEHTEELSPTCRNFLARAAAFEAKMKASCGSAFEEHCGRFRGKPDEMRACIRKNGEHFSPSCQEFLKAAGRE